VGTVRRVLYHRGVADILTLAKHLVNRLDDVNNHGCCTLGMPFGPIDLGHAWDNEAKKEAGRGEHRQGKAIWSSAEVQEDGCETHWITSERVLFGFGRKALLSGERHFYLASCESNRMHPQKEFHC
jgi:hypothetical protein